MKSTIPETISSSFLFSGMSPLERDALLMAGRMRHYEKGQRLFTHGDPVTHFYIIGSGTIQLYRESPEGDIKTTDLLIAGQSICHTEIFDNSGLHQTNALAVDNVVAIEFSIQWLKENARKNGTLALNLLTKISKQTHEAQLEAEHQATMSAAQLVSCFLQRVCVLHDADPQGFDLPYSKSLIASRLGMEIETFSRTLAKLKDNGITVSGTHVTIRDLEKIEDYACSACSMSGACDTHQILSEKMEDCSAIPKKAV